MDRSLVKGVYDVTIDRVSAYEMLEQRAAQSSAARSAPGLPGLGDLFGGAAGKSPGRASSRQNPLEAFASSAARSLGTQIGRQLVRGVMGSLFGTGTRRR
jgi:hypothetical protein